MLGIIDMRIYQIPQREAYEEGVKYALTFAHLNPFTGEFEGDYLRYDNYKGHGHHKHIKGKREVYDFEDIDKLIKDFYSDLEKILEEA